jgi:hypothetical protein
MSRTRFLRAAAWLALAAILFVTICPLGLRPETLTEVSGDRAAAFAITALLFALGYPENWKRTALLLMLAAAGFEALQLLAPTRHARVDDALVKAAGAFLGVAAVQIFRRLRSPRMDKSNRSAGEATALDLRAVARDTL